METGRTESQEHIFKYVMIFVFIFKKQAMKNYFCKTGSNSLIFINPQATNVIYIYMEHPFLMFLDHT